MENKKQKKWSLMLGASLLAVSLSAYLIQIVIFNRKEDTFFYMLQDIAFVPIQVLLVTLILNELLSRRERLLMLRKLNMVIGVFFNELGTELLQHLSLFDRNGQELGKGMIITPQWNDQKFQAALQDLKVHRFEIDTTRGDLRLLRDFLTDRRGHMLTLMENPNLLEHDTFTDMLLAVSHMADELSARRDLQALPQSDLDHIIIDLKRASTLLTVEWLGYMQHMKKDYPFLFSFAVRTNPFNPEASPEVRE